jgi:hypothetical protein
MIEIWVMTRPDVPRAAVRQGCVESLPLALELAALYQHAGCRVWLEADERTAHVDVKPTRTVH